MTKKINIAILASGEGTNAENLIHSIKRDYSHRLSPAVVIANKKNAKVIDRANNLGIEALVIDDNHFQNKRDHEAAILAHLKEREVSWVCLAGYMKILTPNFIHQFKGEKSDFFRILNIHPSLLPHYPGKKSYQRAYEDGVLKSGVSVHLVDEEIDTGKILLQESFPRKKSDTLDDFIKRGKQVESRLYPKALDFIVNCNP